MIYTNELIHETSPYLLQHAHNPVNWYPWGEKAFKKAFDENKMLIISIGYAACHWCHVMEHESFEDEDIAAFMNEYFVSIKVDREERPDVDMNYMTAAQLINGSGGWPLNALALPDGKPFFAATYFLPARWIQLLRYFVNEYKTNKKELSEQAEHLSKGIVRSDHLPFNEEAPAFSEKEIEKIFDNITGKVDLKNGGLASPVKFPMPSVWEWLLAYYHHSKSQEALEAVTITLDKIKDGGIYDQIGGGFARYSTDPYWHLPHFEKMLYDNAQFISLYSHAYQVTGNDEYRRIVQETVRFIKKELFDGHGFYSALDADSEGEEGKYYIWTIGEIRDILGEDADVFCEYFGITAEGNWEDGKNIPDRNLKRESRNIAGGRERDIINRGRKKLLEHRDRRIKPALDDKILTSWNAMTASSLIAAYRAFGEREYYKLGSGNVDFLLNNLWDNDNKVLFRNFQKGRSATPGFLDDYAFLIKALIGLYQVNFDIACLEMCKTLVDVVQENFINTSNKMFYYNDARFNQLISRPTETEDGVIPSSNSVMAENLFILGTLFDDEGMIHHAEDMVGNMKKVIFSHASYQSNWAGVLLKMAIPAIEVAILGGEWDQKLSYIQKTFVPGAVFCGSSEMENLPLLLNKFQPGKTMIYVCRNKTCQNPTSVVEEALHQIGG